MAENKNKTKYKFGSQEFDGELYLRNLKGNAQGFLDSQTDWTPEQKEEWKHSYTNYMNALQDDIANGGGRFSTDEFGSIIDNRGEFSNKDDDNFLYNQKGEQINQEQYDQLRKRKQKKYNAFTSNQWFASYANAVGKKLAQALAEKNGDSTNDTFDYAKNGFASYWQKKYNPAGDSNDASIYWKMDKEGQYGNRINQTVADLNDYLTNSDLPDNVKQNIEQYRDTLSQYSTDSKFDLDTWKNNVNIAASKAGLNSWNSGFFNFGGLNADGTIPQPTGQEHQFDINNDEDVLNRYPEIKNQIEVHPELKDRLLANARAQYNQETQDFIQQDNKRKADEAWNNWLKKNPGYVDVRKRQFNADNTFGKLGVTNNNSDIIWLPQQGRQILQTIQKAFGDKNRRKSDDFLMTPINANSGKYQLNRLGDALAYYLPLMAKTKGGLEDLEEVKDYSGNTIYKLKDSANAKGESLYMYYKDGQLKTYRSLPYNALRKAYIDKAQSGMVIETYAQRQARKEQAQQKLLNNPNTPKEQKRKIAGNQKPKFDTVSNARIIAAAADIGSMIAAYLPGAGTVASAGLGLGSTIANGVADFTDDSVSTGEALGNTALGVGLDLVGLIPGLGTGVKATRIAKTVSKIAPTALTILAASNALDEESRKSWSKISSPSSMTIQDWRNVLNGLNTIAGGHRAIHGHLQANAIKQATNTNKFKITSKSGKQLELSKDQLEQLQNAKTIEDANKLLSKWHPGEEVATKVSSKWQYLRHPQNAANRNQVPNIKPISVFGDIDKNQIRKINNLDLRTMSKLGSWGERMSINPLGWIKNPYVNHNPVINQPTSNKFSHLRGVSPLPPHTGPLNLGNTRPNIPLQNAQNPWSIQRAVNKGRNVKTTFDNKGNITKPTHSTRNRKLWFKEGGSIQKYANGGNTQNSVGYAEGYNWNNDVFSKNIDHILGSLKKYNKGYANWLNQMQDLHYTDYSNASKQDYLNTSAYNAPSVGQYQDKYKAGYEDEWDVSEQGNDPSGIGYNQLGIKNAQDSGKFGIVSKQANSGDWLGDGNEYRTDNSFGGITDARRLLGRKGDFTDEQFNQYQQKFKDLGWDYYLDNTTNYYKLKPIDTPNSPKNTEVAKENPKENPQPNVLDTIKQAYNSLDPTTKWGIPRAIYADRTNRKVTDLMRQTPLLLDPQEDHRYIQSDLDAEINGQRVAGQYNLTVSQPITSDGNLQTMAQLDAVIKGQDAINQGRQQSNQVLRQMAEQAWQQEKENHTNRHNTAMQNRQSIWQTNQQNKQNEAAYLNQKFTIWDALAQELEFNAKQDYELKKSRMDQFIQNDINNSIKYGLSSYKDQYGLDVNDLALWASVYVDGSKKLSDVQKNPEELKRWNKLLNVTKQIQQDALRNYYGIAPSQYYTIPTTGRFDSIKAIANKDNTPTKKKGGSLNIKKIREAAKGEKLAAAQLKAATADADRFNKSVNAFIDRSYDAVDRIRQYSKKKKKRKSK